MATNRSDKAHRVLRFTIGLRDPEVGIMLAPYGMSEDTLREGLRLLNDVAMTGPSPQPAVEGAPQVPVENPSGSPPSK